MNNNCLYHHGIKGQKWGVRRYQNPDGTLTSEGQKRYNSSNNRKNTVENKQTKSSIKEHFTTAIKNIDKEKVLKVGAAAAGVALVAIGTYNLERSSTADIVDSLSQYGKTWADAARTLDDTAERIGTENLSLDETQKWMQRSSEAMTKSGDASYAVMKYAIKGGPSLGERRAYYKAKGGYNGAEALLKYRNDKALKEANSKRFKRQYAKIMERYRSSWDN